MHTQTEYFDGMDIPSEDMAAFLYDLLMTRIEPELVIAALPAIAEKYRGATPDTLAERNRRYREAFRSLKRAIRSIDELLDRREEEQRGLDIDDHLAAIADLLPRRTAVRL